MTRARDLADNASTAGADKTKIDGIEAQNATFETRLTALEATP
jgi:hypothetical protein